MVTGPYRDAAGAEVLEAPTRDGTARLEVAPHHARLEIGQRAQVTVTPEWLTVVATERRRGARPRSMRLGPDHLLVVSRAVPTEDVGLWWEGRPGVITRVLGIRPVELLEAPALLAWKALDRLATRLRITVRQQGTSTAGGFEFGKGQHRVLLVDHGDRMVVYARPLFRERPRRTLEVRRDGTVLIPARGADRSVVCNSRFSVTVLGDRIRFESKDHRDIASIWLPWIAPEDRFDLSRRLGRLVDQAD